MNKPIYTSVTLIILLAAPGDYQTLMKLNLTFNSMVSFVLVNVSIVDDNEAESNEVFFGNLKLLPGSPTNVEISPDIANVTIIDDDGNNNKQQSLLAFSSCMFNLKTFCCYFHVKLSL